MVRIAVCDDNIQELEKIQDLLNRYERKAARCELSVFVFCAPLELLSHVEEQGGFDVYLLDVYMSGMLGTDAARELRRLDSKGEMVFLTSSRSHAVEAFEVDAVQYLVKPYTEEAFYSALDKILNRMSEERRHMVTLKSSEGTVRIFSRDILYTESSRNNYQVIHTIQGEKIEVRITSSVLFDLISPSKSFVKCGASINVNLRFIRQIKKGMILLDSGEQIAYPYRAYQNLKDEFLRFHMGME